MPTVLLIDDDTDHVAIHAAILRAADYEVVCAGDGPTGRSMATTARPDAIVLDVMMQTRTEGFHLARDLRADPATAAIPIIVLTAINRRVPWRFGGDEPWLAVEAFLEKPVPADSLVSAVRSVIGHGKGS